MEKLELSHIADGNVKWYGCFKKQFENYVPQNMKYRIMIWAQIPFLGIYIREIKVYGYIKTSTWIIIAALFLIAKMKKQLSFPPTAKRVNKCDIFMRCDIILWFKKWSFNTRNLKKLWKHEKWKVNLKNRILCYSIHIK